MDLTPICGVSERGLFSNCFIDGAVKRIQERKQFVAWRYGTEVQRARRVDRQAPTCGVRELGVNETGGAYERLEVVF